MSEPIYDKKGRVMGYKSVSFPSGETFVSRPRSLTERNEKEDAQEVYRQIWRNKCKRG